MKVSDVGHVSKAQRVHVRWTDLICEEMFRQGDEEKRLQLKVRRERERGCAERGWRGSRVACRVACRGCAKEKEEREGGVHGVYLRLS